MSPGYPGYKVIEVPLLLPDRTWVKAYLEVAPCHVKGIVKELCREFPRETKRAWYYEEYKASRRKPKEKA